MSPSKHQQIPQGTKAGDKKGLYVVISHRHVFYVISIMFCVVVNFLTVDPIKSVTYLQTGGVDLISLWSTVNLVRWDSRVAVNMRSFV